VHVSAPLQGTVVSIDVRPEELVHAEQPVAVLESMKMEHVVTAPADGVVVEVLVEIGATVMPGDLLLRLRPARDGRDGPAAASDARTVPDPDSVRADLAAVVARHEQTLDGRRPDAVARRHGAGRRTARENVADLVDPGSWPPSAGGGPSTS
jgi:pyruvate/2-oxoglutarate dehydrogenase complex dihydrolipoamide acyltransferase (E2) component